MSGSVGGLAARAGRGALARVVALPSRLPWRFRAWQSLRREQVLVTDFGPWTFFYPSSSVIGRSVAEGKGWEPTLGSMLNIMLPADEPLLIADIGSNIGTSLAQMISVRPAARYVCFEPSERFRSVLNRNIAENDWDNVLVEACLVGADSRAVPLYTNTSTASVASRHYGGHVFLHATTSPVVRLDDYFRDAARLDLIKTDTDGFDADVLLGSEAILSRLAPVLYFEFAPFLTRNVGRGPGEPLGYLNRLGYRTFVVFHQAGEQLAITDDTSDVIELAEQHKYVDVLTAARPKHVAALAEVAAATAPADLELAQSTNRPRAT